MAKKIDKKTLEELNAMNEATKKNREKKSLINANGGIAAPKKSRGASKKNAKEEVVKESPTKVSKKQTKESKTSKSVKQEVKVVPETQEINKKETWTQESAKVDATKEQKVLMTQEVQPESKAEPKAEAKPESKPEPKAETKAESKPKPKAEAKAESKPEPRVDAKPESKPEPKAEAKPENKPEIKSEPKPEEQKETETAVKSEVRPEIKVETISKPRDEKASGESSFAPETPFTRDNTAEGKRVLRPLSIDLYGKSEQFKKIIDVALAYEEVEQMTAKLRKENAELTRMVRKLKEENELLEENSKALMVVNQKNETEIQRLTQELKNCDLHIDVLKSDKIESSKEFKNALAASLKIYYEDFKELKSEKMDKEIGQAIVETFDEVIRILGKNGINMK